MITKANESFVLAHRLRHTSDFRRILRSRKVCRAGMFACRSLPNDQPSARLGLSVPARRMRKAVRRNQVKRAIRETFRRHCAQLPHCDYLIVYQGPPTPDPREVRDQLNQYWQRNTR